METLFEPIIAPLVVAAISFVAALVYGLRKYRMAVIELRLLNPVPEVVEKFYISKIKDGKDEVVQLDPENIKKKVKYKEKNRVAIATFWYRKNLGFQFKCFIDVLDIKKGRDFLESNGFNGISIDETISNRIWFLVPTVPTTVTKDKEKYKNNFFHPGIKKIVYDGRSNTIKVIT